MSLTDNMVIQNLGGRYQLVLEKPEDLLWILELNEAYWVANSAPVDGLTVDPVFLRFLDDDTNGRVRTDELKKAIRWLFQVLTDRSEMVGQVEALRLGAINVDDPEGAKLKASAERILKNLGAGLETISLAQVRNLQKIMSSAVANGDGVIPPEAIEDEELAAFARDVAAASELVDDASGLKGVTATGLEAFLEESKKYLAWCDRKGEKEVMPFGDETLAAYAAYSAIETKIDQYFSLCKLMELNPGVAERAGVTVKALDDLNFTDAAEVAAQMNDAPIAPPEKGDRLVLDSHINPAWASATRAFSEEVLPRVLGRKDVRLSLKKWEQVKEVFAGCKKWHAEKPEGKAKDVGEERLRQVLAGVLPEQLQSLITKDKEVAAELEQIDDVERLILYQQWLLEFANNFVSLPRLYDPSRRSMLEMGTLVLDGRRFDLCVIVKDRNAHKKIAAESQAYLMYVAISNELSKEQSFEVAVAVTGGTTRLIYKGKNGIFFTPDGREWDAKIVDIVENPVSLWEAVKQPFRRLGEFVGKQAEKFSSSRYKDLEKGIDRNIVQAEKTVVSGPQNKAQSARDLMMGGGVALAALGGTFALVVDAVSKVSMLQVLGVTAALLAIVLIPTLIVAIIKLRRRNLGPLLEACGWAINGDLKLTRRVGALFTKRPALPKNVRKRRRDLANVFLKPLGWPPPDWDIWALAIILIIAAVISWIEPVWKFIYG